MAGKIFISYRRSENDWQARALFERLWRHFPHRVFIDLEGVKPGADFANVIDEHLEGCFVMLAVIGPKWIEEIHDRLTHDEVDYVQIELARALGRGIPVVPVLVDGASIPKERELPNDLKRLAKRHALDLATKFFDGQMAILEREIRSILSAAGEDVDPGLIPVQWVTDKKAVEAKADATGLGHAGAAPAIVKSRTRWMSDEGTDQFGRWAEFKVDSVIQRLRWIEPGEFWMGSTEAERRRFADVASEDLKKWMESEKPRHKLLLTQGYWLADTECSQELWRSVTGHEPSNFTGDLQLPVEQVSWDDVTRDFLPELSRRVPGLQAVLPTEAQWEYACRGGTETAYAFGDAITPDQVNFDGDFPTPGCQKGLNRRKTLSVKALPANAWGLHQMHGNVWEWCADAKRHYSAAAAKDPDGGQDGGRRAVRGGSWIDGAARARSAVRSVLEPSARYAALGFRLALKSID